MFGSSAFISREFFVPHLVRHGTSVSVVLSNRPSHLSAMERAQIQKISKRQKYVDTRHQRAHVSKNKNKMQLFIYFLLFWFFLFCYVLWFFFILEIKGEVGSNHRISLNPPLVLRIHNKL